MQFLKNPNFDFIGKRKVAWVLSALLILAGIVSLVMHGGPLLSIDFRGGTVVEVRIDPPVEVGQVRTALIQGGIAVDQVTTFGGPDEIRIAMAVQQDFEEAAPQKTPTEVLADAFPGNEVEFRGQGTVGPKIGDELRRGATNSVFVALTLIVLYLTFRFVFQYGVAAVITLTHDVLIVLGLFSLLNKEISLNIVAAFLTIIGYSLNDTIVVFDRIRENMRLRRKESYEEVVNRSINETLSRTVITSLTTLAVAGILFFMGGSVIHDFAFALVVGVVVGTYSSIFIASPMLIFWYKWRSSDRKRTKKAPSRAKATTKA